MLPTLCINNVYKLRRCHLSRSSRPEQVQEVNQWGTKVHLKMAAKIQVGVQVVKFKSPCQHHCTYSFVTYGRSDHLNLDDLEPTAVVKVRRSSAPPPLI